MDSDLLFFFPQISVRRLCVYETNLSSLHLFYQLLLDVALAFSPSYHTLGLLLLMS